MRILFVLLLTVLCSCSEFDQNNQDDAEIGEYPDTESWDTEMLFTKQGKRRAVLNAGYVAKYSQKQITVLKDSVRVDFYDDQGELKSYLTSQEGKVFDQNKDMVAIGNVVVIAKNGTHLFTEELYWKNEEERIVSNVPVMITTENDTIYGDSFSSDPDLVNYEITNTRGTSKTTISIEE